MQVSGRVPTHLCKKQVDRQRYAAGLRIVYGFRVTVIWGPEGSVLPGAPAANHPHQHCRKFLREVQTGRKLLWQAVAASAGKQLALAYAFFNFQPAGCPGQGTGAAA